MVHRRNLTWRKQEQPTSSFIPTKITFFHCKLVKTLPSSYHSESDQLPEKCRRFAYSRNTCEVDKPYGCLSHQRLHLNDPSSTTQHSRRANYRYHHEREESLHYKETMNVSSILGTTHLLRPKTVGKTSRNRKLKPPRGVVHLQSGPTGESITPKTCLKLEKTKRSLGQLKVKRVLNGKVFGTKWVQRFEKVRTGKAEYGIDHRNLKETSLTTTTRLLTLKVRSSKRKRNGTGGHVRLRRVRRRMWNVIYIGTGKHRIPYRKGYGKSCRSGSRTAQGETLKGEDGLNDDHLREDNSEDANRETTRKEQRKLEVRIMLRMP
ncbi:hypothetical protein GOBAR_DD20207 [Gossypium barbadense]|nr:hypothetical protein GOBAR_DD20207 [Gossypium barbadense]